LGLSENVLVEKNEEGVFIIFPKDKQAEGIEGNISFYRPSKKQLDFSLPIMLADGSMLIPHEILVPGRWDVQVEWTYEGQRYISRKKLMY
jgi:nitrogen fixation protein FixH